MTALRPPTLPMETAEPERPRRSWVFKFSCAFRGLKLGIRGHSSFCARHSKAKALEST